MRFLGLKYSFDLFCPVRISPSIDSFVAREVNVLLHLMGINKSVAQGP